MAIRKNIKTTNIEFTTEISDYLDKRLFSIEKLIDPNDTSAMFDIEIGKTTEHHQSGNIFRAEINLHVAGKQLRASAEDATILNAIDKVEKEMIREFRRFKGKKRRLFIRGGVAIKSFMNALGTGGARIRDFARRRRK
jgi:ribosomal subunit interface protein